MSSNARAKWLKEFNQKDSYPFKFLDSTIVFCAACEKSFAGTQKSIFQQHMKSDKHMKNVTLKDKRKAVQAQLEDVLSPERKKSRSEIVGTELCRSFLAANVPLWKLDNPTLKNFLEENLGINIPEQSTLRKNYVPACYEEVRSKIILELDGHPFWLGIDETCDAAGRCVANILISRLNNESYHPPFLLGCIFLEDGTAGSVARAVNDCLRSFWPNLDSNLFKILLTDAATAMIKAGKDLRIFFPRLLSVTCLAHAIHRLCEEVRDTYEELNDLISSIKKVFLKAPSRVTTWRECCPNLPLPPEPCITR